MQSTLERLRQRRDEKGGEGGFTLIELLIVIVILGILAAIVVFAVQNLSSTSAKSSCKSDFKTVETAVEAYKAQEGQYPTANSKGVAAADTNGVAVLVKGDGTLGPWLRDIPYNSGHYMITVSVDGNGTVKVASAPATAPTNATVGGLAEGTAADCSAVS